jgi:hypothetical protein
MGVMAENPVLTELEKDGFPYTCFLVEALSWSSLIIDSPDRFKTHVMLLFLANLSHLCPK